MPRASVPGDLENPDVHLSVHSPHPTADLRVEFGFFTLDLIALTPPTIRALSAGRALFYIHLGLSALCYHYLAARVPQPIPIFLRAPPKPLISWPLKWFRKI